MSRLATIPGVEHVGGINRFPLDTGPMNGKLHRARPSDEVQSVDDWMRLTRDTWRVGNAQFRVASLGYFGAMAIPLIRGRLFDERDAVDAPHVALISASLAEARWPGGRSARQAHSVRRDGRRSAAVHVVGIVGDVQEFGIGSMPRRPSMPTTLSALDLRSSSMS